MADLNRASIAQSANLESQPDSGQPSRQAAPHRHQHPHARPDRRGWRAVGRSCRDADPASRRRPIRHSQRVAGPRRCQNAAARRRHHRCSTVASRTAPVLEGGGGNPRGDGVASGGRFFRPSQEHPLAVLDAPVVPFAARDHHHGEGGRRGAGRHHDRAAVGRRRRHSRDEAQRVRRRPLITARQRVTALGAPPRARSVVMAFVAAAGGSTRGKRPPPAKRHPPTATAPTRAGMPQPCAPAVRPPPPHGWGCPFHLLARPGGAPSRTRLRQKRRYDPQPLTPPPPPASPPAPPATAARRSVAIVALQR